MNRVIEVPKRPRYVLVFDVETTGLFPKKKRGSTVSPPIDELPYIIQLSYVIFDMEKYETIEQYDTYINIDETVKISEFVSNLTGITHEMCHSEGVPIIEALKKFYKAYMFCECIVAHNMDFDTRMISLEIERNRETILENAPYCILIFNGIYEELNNIERYCTMRKGTPICNIDFPKKTQSNIEYKSTNKKFPTLKELYMFLFNMEEPPANLHNSMVDVMVCLKCYLYMRHKYCYTSDLSEVVVSSSNMIAIAA